MSDPRHDLDQLTAELASRGCTVKGKAATCPWHEDRNPSASILCGADGVWRLWCHVCNRRAHVLDLRSETAGRPVGDLLREINAEERPMQTAAKPAPPDLVLPDKMAVKRYAERIGAVEAWYTYGPKAAPVLVVARIMPPMGKKTFRQFTPTGAGWAPRNLVERGKIPLYRVAELGADVLVVEGEKSAEAAWSVGIPATTSAMGAGKAAESDWSPLAGKRVCLWPDNDDTGRKHMAQVAEILTGINCQVSMIEAADLDLPEKGDIADLLERLDSQTSDQLAKVVRDIIAAAAPIDPAAELTAWTEQVIAGKWASLDWPLDRVGKLSRACLPGTLGLWCADPGAGKSWLALQLAAWWRALGHKVALRMLEDDKRTHLARLLAQLDGCADLTSDTWIRANPERTRQAMARHREAIADAARWITAEDDTPPSLPDLCTWVERQASAGARVIIVDPITACAPEAKPWIADFTAAMRLKRCARESGATILLTTHPRGMGVKGPSLASMAGGSAWPRFSHSALWLERMEPSELRLNTGDTGTCNRVVHITKCRHGRGAGLSVGLVFDMNTARFREVGTLAPSDAGQGRRVRSDRTTSGRDRAAGVTAEDRQWAEEMRARGEKLRQSPHAGEDAFADGVSNG